MEKSEGAVCISGKEGLTAKRPGRTGMRTKIGYKIVTFAVFVMIWQFAAASYKSDLLLPPPWTTGKAFLHAIGDVDTLKNLLLTLERVAVGFGIAFAIGTCLGFLMGYSKAAMQLIDPVFGMLRQIPIMAWVPLTIIWFGLGDGPTIFMIAMVGVFPILLNTIAGVQAISRDYFNAARTMGAGPWSLFKDVMLPAAMPDVLTGMRLAVGAGWMSVI